MNKINLPIILLLSSFMLFIPTIIYLFDNSLLLFPNSKFNSRIEASASQNSAIEYHFNARQLHVSFILKKRPESDYYPPFCSLVFWLKNNESFFDLSGYDYLTLEIEKAISMNMVIFIKTYVQGISNQKKAYSYTLRHNEYTQVFISGVSRYRINIKDFITPDWWFEIMQVPADKRGKEEYIQVAALDFQFINRDNVLLEEKETLVITHVSFHKSYPLFYIALNSLSILLLFLAVKKGIEARLLKTQIALVNNEIPHKPLECESHADHEMSRIRQYLEENYNDPQISSDQITRETGISRSHITQLIKKEYNSTCKQIINQIRIKEAKRLLETSDLRILEIALQVGFNDITTFNRCFKKAEGTTPREYRSCFHQKNS